jgi:tetratricopeptide (TPR) repeat protein
MTTAEQERKPVASPPITLRPQVVTLLALIVYGITLNHWVSLESLPVVGKIAGWDWHPGPIPWRGNEVMPLWMLVTLPFRMVPVHWQPIALNIFTALCAALTLAILARSVRLLPHDRTREQRQREGGEFALLSLRHAYMPAALAVLVLGLQTTFWENAISATGEMFDLLLFASLVLCILEYRISQNDGWLFALALGYGVSVTNNWALLGFFPCFLISVIWVKGLAFFNWRFLVKMTLLGLAGLSLYLLMPIVGAIHGDDSFWPLLKQHWIGQLYYIHLIPRWVTLLASVATLVPLFFAAIRWPSFEGEVSVGGGALTRFMIKILHVFFLGIALLLFTNFRFGPSPMAHELPGFLSFYYLGAICVGYFTGYLLLLFGRDALSIWQRPKPFVKMLCRLGVALVWLVAIAAPCWLVYTNLPRIRAENGDVITQYAEQVAKALPDKPSIVLCDDRVRALLFEAVNQRLGRGDQNALVETGAFRFRDYLRYLANRYPQIGKSMISPDRLPPVLTDIEMVEFLRRYSDHQPVFYLHPSFGYFFEAFYLKPQGLVYELKQMPTNTLSPPLPGADDISLNEKFWNGFKDVLMPQLPAQAALGGNPKFVASYYSQALDLWAVDLQRAGTREKSADLLAKANERLTEAVQLNPSNVIAQVNLQFNARLRGASPPPINASELLEKDLILYGGLEPLLNRFGPVDDPDTDLQFGRRLAEGNNLRQAGALFERTLDVRPGDPEAELGLAKTYVDIEQPDRALELVPLLRNQTGVDANDVTRVEAIAYFKKGDYARAEKILKDAYQQDPKDGNRLSTLVEFYRKTAYMALEHQDTQAAQERFVKALNGIEERLKLLNSPTYSSANLSDIPNTLMMKAQVQSMLARNTEAVETMTQFLQNKPDDPAGLFYRANYEFQITNYPAAKSDYLRLQKVLPEPSFEAYHALGKMADEQKDTSEAVRYYKLCLKHANTNWPGYQVVEKRLQELSGH